MAFRQHTKIFTVFSFLRLRSVDIFWYQWIYPTVLATVICVGFHWFGSQLISFDTEKVISDINSLMGILIGFYIAALAAVSSFSNANLDQVMKGRAPTLTSVRGGQEIIETLTRRRFLSVLFGYCATVSILLYILSVFFLHLSLNCNAAPWIHTAVGIANFGAWAVYTWLICSLLIVTLLGLHYLVERMHRA